MAALLKLIFLFTASGSGILLARGGTFSLSRFLFLAVSISIALDTYAGIILLAMGGFSVNGILVVSGFLLAAGLVISVGRKGASLRLKSSGRDFVLLLLICVGAVLLLPSSEFLIANNDGNTYFCTGVNLARNGTWSIPDSFLAEIPAKLTCPRLLVHLPC